MPETSFVKRGYVLKSCRHFFGAPSSLLITSQQIAEAAILLSSRKEAEFTTGTLAVTMLKC